MRILRPKNRAGYSLVEMMVTLSIFTVVMAGVYTIFLVGNKSWINFTGNVVTQHNLRQGMLTMSKELRRAKHVFLTKEEGSVRINFLRPPVGLVSYVWSAEGEDAHKIIRHNNVNKKVIASNIRELDMVFEQNAIIINMTSGIKNGKTIQNVEDNVEGPGENEFQLKGKIALRSKVYANKKQ